MSMNHSQPLEQVIEKSKSAVKEAHKPWYVMNQTSRILFFIYAIQLILFAILAWWVHATPVSPIDIVITREFQENTNPWLKVFMIIISYPGNSFLLPFLIIITAGTFWIVGLRLEGLCVVILSVVSALLNVFVKLLVNRPRPSAMLVEVLQVAIGKSFPSGHVMAYLAFWGLLFSFSIILFRGWAWWRITLMSISAIFVILIGPARIYLGDHWASDVLGSYLIGGVLLAVTLWIYLRLKSIHLVPLQ